MFSAGYAVGLSDLLFMAPTVNDSTVIAPHMAICGRLDGIYGVDVSLECAPGTSGRYLYIYPETINGKVDFYEIKVNGADDIGKF